MSSKNRAAATQPRQQRSRETQERLLQATERLMSRTGTADFNLPDVSRESGVSIGGIYRRFADKEALLLAVQERLYRRMSDEYVQVEDEARRNEGGLRHLVNILVAGEADLVKRNSSLIKAIMEATWSYAEVAKGGVRSFASHRRRFKAMLLLERRSIRHANPEFAIEFCFVSVFELVASHIGVGRRAQPEHSPWPVLVGELQRLCYAYLTAADSRLRSTVPPGKKPSRKTS